MNEYDIFAYNYGLGVILLIYIKTFMLEKLREIL